MVNRWVNVDDTVHNVLATEDVYLLHVNVVDEHDTAFLHVLVIDFHDLPATVHEVEVLLAQFHHHVLPFLEKHVFTLAFSLKNDALLLLEHVEHCPFNIALKIATHLPGGHKIAKVNLAAVDVERRVEAVGTSVSIEIDGMVITHLGVEEQVSP